MSTDRGDRQDHEQIEGDSDYESSSNGQRAGRFYGPDSSWRYYTHDERALAMSIQQTENDDLSIALYNVHAMKVRTRGAECISAAKPWHSKGRWIQSAQNGQAPFQPPPRWTAWPLNPAVVPRTREVWGSSTAHPDEEANTYSKAESWKPSLNLQEELKSGFLRQAKDRFNGRQWEAEHLHDSPSGSALQERSRDLENESDQEKADSMADDVEVESAAPHSPVFLADDDVASSILQPTVRHVISRQDHLLSALHQSRRGHRMGHSFTTRSKRKDSSRIGTSVKPKSKRKCIAPDTFEPRTSSPEHHEAVNANSKTIRRPRGQYRRLPGQRDWSEVLGVAAMAGWNQSVIDRAARRCTALFGEGMSMRFTSKGPTEFITDKVVEYVPDMIPSVETSEEPSTEAFVEEDSNACPHVSCRRHQEPYEKRWRLREHLKKGHNYSAKELQDWKLQANKRARRNTPIVLPSSDEEADDAEDQVNDIEDLDRPIESERESFPEPITVRIGRSRDKRPRASASRSRLKNAALVSAAGEEGVGSGNAMSTDSEL